MSFIYEEKLIMNYDIFSYIRIKFKESNRVNRIKNYNLDYNFKWTLRIWFRNKSLQIKRLETYIQNKMNKYSSTRWRIKINYFKVKYDTRISEEGMIISICETVIISKIDIIHKNIYSTKSA